MYLLKRNGVACVSSKLNHVLSNSRKEFKPFQQQQKIENKMKNNNLKNK